MPRYNVHIFREISYQFNEIEADSYEEAIEEAKTLGKRHDAIESTQDIGFLVDVEGDSKFKHTRSYNSKVERIL